MLWHDNISISSIFQVLIFNLVEKTSGSLRKQIPSSIIQQNQEFSIQNEDFPALPGFKGC